MNKKRWLALGLAVLIIVLQFIVPKPEYNQTLNSDMFADFLPYSIHGSGDESFIAETLEEGSTNSQIAIINLNGQISSGSSVSAAGYGYSHPSFMNQLDYIENNENIKAVLFVVNSPGGAVFESAEIKDGLLTIQEKREIPIYVSMQNYAASGGYYISAYADKIYATDETWTGSIGVILQSLNFSGFMDKYGFEMNTVMSGSSKDLGSSFREWSDSDEEVFQSLIDESYNKFVDIIAEGRNMDRDKVLELADGRIYSGPQAVENGLVDEIAYKEEVLEDLKRDFSLEEAKVVEYNANPYSSFTSLFSKLEMKLKSGVNPEILILEKLSKESLAPRPMYLYGGE